MKVQITLRTRLVILVLTAIVPLFGLSVIKAMLNADTAISRATDNLQFTASLVAANAARVADSARQILTSIVHMPTLTGNKTEDCQRYFKTLNDLFAVYTNLGVIGLDGKFRCHGVDNRADVFVGDREYFKQALARRDFVASGYLVGRGTGTPIISFAMPVMDSNQKPSAVAFASLDLKELSKSVADTPLPNGGQLVIIDRQGVVLAASPEKSALTGQKVSSPLIQDAIKGMRTGIGEDTDARGVNRIYAFLPVGLPADAPFFVAVSVDRAGVVAPARMQLWLEFIGLAVTAFLGGWIAWLMGGRVIVRPTAAILRATRQLQSGRLDVRIPLRGAGTAAGAGDEFTRMADGFNRMAEAMEQREHDLAAELASSRQAHAELEQLQLAQTRSFTELHETQRKLLDTQRLGRIGHLEMDLLTQKISWSDEVYVLFDVVPGAFDGRLETFLLMIHPQDRGDYEARRSLAVTEGSEFEVDYRIITPAGDIRWIHQWSKHYSDDSGQALYRAGVVQEITARKQSELALADTSDLLRRTGEMAMVGGWELVLDGMRLNYSEQIYQMIDLMPGSVLTLEDVKKSFPPEARRVLASAVEAAVKQGTSWDIESPLITGSGRRIWVRTQGKAFMRDGRVVRLSGVLQDITAQHASQEHMRLLQTSIARLNDILLITDAEPVNEPGPRIVFVNDAFERRTGYSRKEVLGKSPRLLQGPKTQRAELDRIAAALKKWQPVRSELINYTKTGEEFWIELDIVPVADDKGSYTHWVAVQRDITQRKLAEQALVDSEQRYAALFELAPVPMWVDDIATKRFLTVNRAALRSYGYSADEFLVMTIFDIRPESEHALVREHLLAAAPSGKESWQHRRKDGTVFTVNLVSKPIQYAGRAARFVVALDISAQVKAEKEVQDYLFTLQRAADAAQAITWHQTLDGMLQEFADQARGVIGAHQAVVSLAVGRGGVQAINALSLSEKYADYRELTEPINGSGIYELVCDNNRAMRLTQAELEAHPRWRGFGSYAGKHPPMRGWLALPLMGRNGENIGLLQLSDKYEGEFTQQDEYVAIELAQLASVAIENARLLAEVSQLNTGLEQKVADRTAALSRQERLFRALADQAPQVVWTVSPTGMVTYLNRAWFELVGGQLQDWTGIGWHKVIHPEDMPGIRANWEAATASQLPYVGIRRLLAKDGSYHTMSYRGSPVLDENGEVAFWVGIDADISEMKAIEAALRLSNQELEAFSYSVSHDLRSPLNTIDGFSRLLAKQLAADLGEKGQHYLSRIQAGVAQMGKLIEDLLSLAQVSRMQLRYESVDLSALSQRILNEWQARHPDRQVVVHIESGLQAHGDARLVKVVMENLLGNAWKFTSQQPQAIISVGQKQDSAGVPAFFVGDNGAGFDMAYADKLFIAFQRLHAASEFPGTGIGLATVSRVIGRHGGRLWAESAPGLGATFFFTLPKIPLPV